MGLIIERMFRVASTSLSDLVCTLIGDMYDTIGVPMQQVTCTDAHTGDRHFTYEVHADGVAMGDDKPGAEVLEAAERTDFPDIAQATICEDTNGSKLIIVDDQLGAQPAHIGELALSKQTGPAFALFPC